MRVLILLVVLATAVTPLHAQRPQLGKQWQWSELRSAAGVNVAEVAWLEEKLSAQERDHVISMVSALSQPEAAQLLPHYAEIDGTTIAGAMAGRAFIDSLRVRPPEGAIGAVRVAYLVARARTADLERRRKFGTYRAEFTGKPFKLIPSPRLAAAKNASVRLSFNAAPAESLLAIVATPDRPALEIIPRVSTPAFDYMIHHHNQRFYRIPATREQLALTLAAATSSEPLARLYRYANPRGLYHYTDVATHQQQYRTIVQTLKRNEAAIAAEVDARLAPFLPPNTNVSRTLWFYFGDGSDGWAIDTVAAVVLEYYKDDYEQMIEVAVHELFHLAQSAIVKAPATARSGVDSVIAEGLSYTLEEGTAYYIAPATKRTPDEEAVRVQAGVKLIETLAAMTSVDKAVAQETVDKGVSSGGPFYSLGGAMSRVIVQAYGPQGLAGTLQKDEVEFFKTYTRAAQKLRVPNFFPKAVIDRITAM